MKRLAILSLLLLLAACGSPEAVSEPPEIRYLRAQGRYEEARALAERYRQEAEAARIAMTATRDEAARQAMATRQALEALATRQALEAMATRQAMEVRATATAQAAEVQAMATATVEARMVATARAMPTATAQMAELARRLAEEEAARRRAEASARLAPVVVIGQGLFWGGLGVLILVAAYGLYRIFALRLSVMRRKADLVLPYEEWEVEFRPWPVLRRRMTLMDPGRMPGPAMVVDRSGPRPIPGDPAVTARDQAISLAREVGMKADGETMRRLARTPTPPAIEVMENPDPEVRRWIREVEAQAVQELPG